MKTSAMIFGTAILVAAAAASSGPSGQDGKHEHQKNKEEASGHGEHAEHDNAGGMDMEGMDMKGMDMEGMDHMGGHMQHMVDVQKWLKKELGDQYDQPLAAVSEAQLRHGKEVYSKTCVVCHGESGKGDGPVAAAFTSKPADFTDPEHSKSYSDQGRVYIIKKGVPDTPMAGWEATLSEADIQAVYGYVRSLRSAEGSGGHGHGDSGHTEKSETEHGDQHGDSDNGHHDD